MTVVHALWDSRKLHMHNLVLGLAIGAGSSLNV